VAYADTTNFGVVTTIASRKLGSTLFSSVDRRQLAAELIAGRTLVINSVDMFLRSSILVAQSVGVAPRNVTSCNVYISATGAACGFGKHHDVAPQLVVQMWGSKIWHLFPAVGEEEVVNLTPDSTLLLGAGIAHDTRTVDGLSIHATYTVRSR
jgi:ribosomal protein L16 Arg81 hydroxylase